MFSMRSLSAAALIVGALLPAAWAQAPAAPSFTTRPGYLPGYLPQKDLPDSLALLPAPPASGSAGFAVDEEFSRKALGLRDTPRWALATQDADLTFPNAAGAFSCALGAPITEKDTPHLYVLLRRSLADAGLATYSAKNHYGRHRPFMTDNAPICTPQAQKHLMTDGSYPSGHSAAGFAWALILSEVAPDRGDALLVRGQAFGQSRIVCNAHWESDVVEGRVVGAATVARLHGNAAFLADLDAARVEVTAVRAKALKPMRDCGVEAAAMALDPETAP